MIGRYYHFDLLTWALEESQVGAIGHVLGLRLTYVGELSIRIELSVTQPSARVSDTGKKKAQQEVFLAISVTVVVSTFLFCVLGLVFVFSVSGYIVNSFVKLLGATIPLFCQIINICPEGSQLLADVFAICWQVYGSLTLWPGSNIGS